MAPTVWLTAALASASLAVPATLGQRGSFPHRSSTAPWQRFRAMHWATRSNEGCRRALISPRVQHGVGVKLEKGSLPQDSFVQTEMRKASMKLHTREQSKEGEQKPSKPIPKWEFSPEGVMQFLVDTQKVHQTLDDVAAAVPELKDLYRASDEIRRIEGIKTDIKNVEIKYPSLTRPQPSEQVEEYASSLSKMAAENIPGFVCHYYNTHFANAAGGRMIGKFVSDKLFEGETLKLYKYGDGKRELEQVRVEIDNLAAKWSPEERQQCLDQTPFAFKAAGAVLQNLR